MSEAGKRLIAGATEALAIARGEEPAASITVNGHRYVPAAEITRLQKELETAREALEPFASDTARNDPNVMLHFGTIRMDRAREVYRALKDKEVADVR